MVSIDNLYIYTNIENNSGRYKFKSEVIYDILLSILANPKLAETVPQALKKAVYTYNLLQNVGIIKEKDDASKFMLDHHLYNCPNCGSNKIIQGKVQEIENGEKTKIKCLECGFNKEIDLSN